MRRSILIAILLCGIFATHAHAWDFAVNGGVGYSYADPPMTNGIWYQNQFPHQWDTQSLAWKAGVRAHHSGWIMDVNYVDLGRYGVVSYAVCDPCYDFQEDRCIRDCETPSRYTVNNHIHGVEAKLGYRWELYDRTTVALMAGGAALFHRLDVDVKHETSRYLTDFDGTIGAAVFAAEACYGWACAEVTYYQKLSENHNPLVGAGIVVPMAIIRIPIGQ